MKMKKLLLVAAALLGLTAASMAQNVPSYVPGNGLVGWWPFNGNANDESGNGNNGTVNGATLTSDRNGDNNTAYSFGGNTRRTIDIDIDLPYGNFTISFWFNALDTTMNALMDWRDTSNNLPVLSFNFDANYGSGFVALLRDNVNGGTVDVAPNFLPNSNEWHFITLTKNSNQLSFYVDGLISLTTNYTQSIWTLNHLVLGSNYYDSTFFYTGRLDDIGIWNRALTQQEITNLYTSQEIILITNGSINTC
ncbi:MAG: LamG domain-containing protein, partial [Bacteroidota bacterium]